MAQTTINIKDLAADGLRLIPSSAVDFAERVTALVGNPSSTDAALIPYSVLLVNSTAHTVRGYALQWQFIDAHGGANANLQVEQNFDPRQRGAEIPPGSARLLSPLKPIRGASTGPIAGNGPSDSTTKRAMLASQTLITVSLDSVAFEDGKVVGPNESFAINAWRQMYKAQHDVAVMAIQQNAQALSPDNFVAWLNAESTKQESHPTGSSTYELLAGESHWYQVYAKTTAQRLLQFNKASTESMLAEATRLAQIPVPTLTR